MFVVPGPQRLKRRQHFVHVFVGIGLLKPRMHAIELALVGTGTDSKLEATATNQVGHCRFAREVDRMPVRRHRNRGTQANIIGIAGPPGQNLKRIRRYRHFQCVMLRGPGNIEPGLVGHLHHFQRMPGDVVHILAVVYALEIDC